MSKSYETQLVEATERLRGRGISYTRIAESWGKSLDVKTRLESVQKKFALELRESRPRRNNGSGLVVEGDPNKGRIASYARKFRCSEREAAAHLGVELQESYKADAKAELRESWRRYCPTLKPHELDTLVARGVPVPQR